MHQIPLTSVKQLQTYELVQSQNEHHHPHHQRASASDILNANTATIFTVLAHVRVLSIVARVSMQGICRLVTWRCTAHFGSTWRFNCGSVECYLCRLCHTNSRWDAPSSCKNTSSQNQIHKIRFPAACRCYPEYRIFYQIFPRYLVFLICGIQTDKDVQTRPHCINFHSTPAPPHKSVVQWHTSS